MPSKLLRAVPPVKSNSPARVDLDHFPPSTATATRLLPVDFDSLLYDSKRIPIPTSALIHDGRQDGRLQAFHRPEAWHVRH
jgi:hypothetical protein